MLGIKRLIASIVGLIRGVTPLRYKTALAIERAEKSLTFMKISESEFVAEVSLRRLDELLEINKDLLIRVDKLVLDTNELFSQRD